MGVRRTGSSTFSVESKWLVHQMGAHNRPAIPQGLNRSAQGWPIPRGLSWVAAFELHNPERVEYQCLRKQIQPFQSCDSSLISPRVALLRNSQPWAARFNPVGIGQTNDDAPNVAFPSTENVEEPKN
jgi:hypothetical protein